MNTKRSLPKAEDFYRHFKGELYQIITVATHTESGEYLVIYRALYGSFKTYARPLSMFLEEVDKEKYPDSKDTYRFTKVEFVPSHKRQQTAGSEDSKISEASSEYKKEVNRQKKDTTQETPPTPPQVSPSFEEDKAMKLFMEFLEEDSFDKKRNILRAIAPIATEHIIYSMAASLDLVPSGRSKEADLKMIQDYISARIHFDGNRLR